MCGIVGYIGERDCAEVLLDGLQKLEYRGYDSAGISVLQNGCIATCKSKGKLREVRRKLELEGKPEGHCGIGHTRWATHGEPSDQNSHPHGDDRISLVHNGIIENYLPLKSMLEKKGVQFCSQTDTEVIVRLIERNYKGNPLAAIRETLPLLRGSYALGILFADHPDTLYAVRKDSPLIVGTAQDEQLIASDIPAILPYTRDYYLLEENELAVLTKDTVEFFDLLGNPIEKQPRTATWDMEAAQKGGYPHFMLKEIHEQPDAFEKTLHPRIKDGLPDLSVDQIPSALFQKTCRIYIVACGTAMHAGLVGKRLIETLAGIPVEVDVASEFRYRHPVFLPGDLAIIISQSGETADSLAALRLAKEEGVPTLSIVNVVGSSIARESDYVLYTYAGPEIAVASTKAYTVQLAAMDLLGLSFAMSRGMEQEKVRLLVESLCRIPDALREILADATQLQQIAAHFQNTEDLFFIGRGLDYAVSQEGSLKLKEISYVHSEAYAAGELKHGTISLVTEGIPVVAIATQKPVYEKMVGNIKEVRARGASVLLLCQKESEHASELADFVVELPTMEDLFLPSLTVLPLQLFAYYMAVLRGCDVDQPRNLAKSVTVE